MLAAFIAIVVLASWSTATRELLDSTVPCKVKKLVPKGVPWLADGAPGLVELGGLVHEDPMGDAGLNRTG